jgi:hypothetical protein
LVSTRDTQEPVGHGDGPRTSLPARIKRHPFVVAVALICSFLTGIVALQSSLGTIYGWLSPHVPFASRLSDELAVRDLATGVQLSVIQSHLGEPTYRASDGPYREAVFVRPNCYVQVLTNKEDRVLMFAVTTRNEHFHPVFKPPGEDDWFKDVELGVTTFGQWEEPDWIGGFFAGSWENYAECVHQPHSAGFHSIVVASSDAGWSFDTTGTPPPDDASDDGEPLNVAIEHNDPHTPWARWYRNGTPINTYGETAADFDPTALYDAKGFPKYATMIGSNPVRVGDSNSPNE